jgi:hypothetical protein
VDSCLDVVAGKTFLPLPEITAVAQQACTHYTELTNNKIPGQWTRLSPCQKPAVVNTLRDMESCLRGYNRKKYKYVWFSKMLVNKREHIRLSRCNEERCEMRTNATNLCHTLGKHHRKNSIGIHCYFQESDHSGNNRYKIRPFRRKKIHPSFRENQFMTAMFVSNIQN